MKRSVQCRKYQECLEGLEAPPFPGRAGQKIYEEISKKAWQAWLSHQTRLINEKQLQLFDPNAQSFLNTEREKFFNNQVFEQAEGYIPPTPPDET